MKAVIKGIGWVTSQGMGSGSDFRIFEEATGALPRLTRKDVFAEPYMRFGRLDDFSRLGLAGIAFALRDAGLSEWDAKRPIGIVASTVYGCLPTDINYFDTVIPEGGALASPNLFAYTLPNCFLGEAAIRFGLTGATYISTEHSPEAGLGGVYSALESISWGECDQLIAGVCDLEPPEGFALEKSFVGSAFFVLSKSEDAENTGYGLLELASGGALTLNGREVGSIESLLEQARCGSNR